MHRFRVSSLPGCMCKLAPFFERREYRQFHKNKAVPIPVEQSDRWIMPAVSSSGRIRSVPFFFCKENVCYTRTSLPRLFPVKGMRQDLFCLRTAEFESRRPEKILSGFGDMQLTHVIHTTSYAIFHFLHYSIYA